MSSSSSPSLVLELNGSWLRHMPALLLLLTALSLPWLAMSWPLAGQLVCAGAGSIVAMLSLWRSGLFRSTKQLSRLSWNREQHWQLQFGNDEPIIVTLSGRSWCAPLVLCLKFRTEYGRRYQFLLWRHELTRQAWHQWLLRLHQEGGSRDSSAA